MKLYEIMLDSAGLMKLSVTKTWPPPRTRKDVARDV